MVRAKGPAGKAGIHVGDRIIEIDGKNVEKMQHDPLAALIKGKRNAKFTVLGSDMDPVNQERDNQARALGQKVFILKKKKNSFGLSMKTEEGEGEGQYEHKITEVTNGGAADVVGVESGMVLLSVNGVNSTILDHGSTVKMIVNAGVHCALRFHVPGLEPIPEEPEAEPEVKQAHEPDGHPVARVAAIEETVQAYVKQAEQEDEQTPVQPAASTEPVGDLPPPRLVRIVKSPTQRFGFGIKTDKDKSMEFINRLDVGGAAHWAGVLEGDIVWTINGVRITGKVILPFRNCSGFLSGLFRIVPDYNSSVSGWTSINCIFLVAQGSSGIGATTRKPHHADDHLAARLSTVRS